MTVRLPAQVGERLAVWSAAEHPLEACGLLLGERTEGEFRVSRAVLAANVAEGPRTRRYEVAPGDLVSADRAARAAGLEIVGVWHSHPERPARPSEHDRKGAYPGWTYLILGADGELTAWRLRDEELVPQVLVTFDET